MARTVQTTGLGANLKFLFSVEDDNATPKLFRSSDSSGADNTSDVAAGMSIGSLGTGVTAGTGTWKGQTVPYFACHHISGTSYGITFGGGAHALPDLTKCKTLYIVVLYSAFDSMGPSVGTGFLLGESTFSSGVWASTTTKKVKWSIGGMSAFDSTADITDGTKLLIAVTNDSTTANQAKLWLPAESDSTASVDSTRDGQASTWGTMKYIGINPDYSSASAWENGKIVAIAGYDAIHTQSDIESVLADPMGTFFESVGGGSVVPAIASALSRMRD